MASYTVGFLRVLIVACYEEPQASTDVGGSKDVHRILEEGHVDYGHVQRLFNVLEECNHLGEGK